MMCESMQTRKSVYPLLPPTTPPVSKRKLKNQPKVREYTASSSIDDARQQDSKECSDTVLLCENKPLPVPSPEKRQKSTIFENTIKKSTHTTSTGDTLAPPCVQLAENTATTPTKLPRKSCLKSKSMRVQSPIPSQFTSEPITPTSNQDQEWDKLDYDKVKLLLETESGDLYPLTFTPILAEKVTIMKHNSECRAALRLVDFGEDKVHEITPLARK